MDYDEVGDVDGVPVRVPIDDSYRTCSECGADCYPDPGITVEGQGARIAFVCAEHGVNAVVDPFEGQR